ncbi:MAG: hypothetical protein O8C67_06060 [Candidatus Methanoperedens sp.]|nr:hypothetical protein [Candidatus Methanoperedens sp.]
MTFRTSNRMASPGTSLGNNGDMDIPLTTGKFFCSPSFCTSTSANESFRHDLLLKDFLSGLSFFGPGLKFFQLISGKFRIEFPKIKINELGRPALGLVKLHIVFDSVKTSSDFGMTPADVISDNLEILIDLEIDYGPIKFFVTGERGHYSLLDSLHY